MGEKINEDMKQIYEHLEKAESILREGHLGLSRDYLDLAKSLIDVKIQKLYIVEEETNLLLESKIKHE